jgi:hypothetical protein
MASAPVSHASFTRIDGSTRFQRNHHPARLQQRVVQFDSLPLYGRTDAPQLTVLRTMISRPGLSVAGIMIGVLDQLCLGTRRWFSPFLTPH